MLVEGSEISIYYLSIWTDTSVFTYSATSCSKVSTIYMYAREANNVLPRMPLIDIQYISPLVQVTQDNHPSVEYS